MQSITVTIAEDGTVSYVVQGVKGASCKSLTRAIDALGTVTETKTTSEFAEAPVERQIKH